MQNLLHGITNTQRSMKNKLRLYMAVLAVILIVVICGGLLFFGRLNSPKDEAAVTLATQMRFFRDDMQELWQSVSVSGVHLSTDMANIIDDSLEERNIDISSLTGDIDTITDIERSMMKPLCEYIRQTDCSGAFVVLNASMRSDVPDAQKSGLFIMRNNAERDLNELLLYRGIASVSKERGIMPHRKWAQEFKQAELFDFESLISSVPDSLWDAGHMTELISIPGTSESSVLMITPIFGSDGTAYGVCGFSVSRTYFAAHYEQPSDLKRLACIFMPTRHGRLSSGSGLVSYKSDGSFTLPASELSEKSFGKGLSLFKSDGMSFVGMREDVDYAKSDGGGYSLAVMVPKSDYDSALAGDILQTIVLAFLLAFFTIISCIYLTRRYMRPVYEDMDKLKSREAGGEQISFDEFKPLSDAISEREREHVEKVTTLESEKEALRGRCEETEGQLDAAKSEAERLAYLRKEELDPAIYEYFLDNYKTLTASEQRALNAIMDGISVAEYACAEGIAMSTAYTHRKNVYRKLGTSDTHKIKICVTLLRKENRA